MSEIPLSSLEMYEVYLNGEKIKRNPKVLLGGLFPTFFDFQHFSNTKNFFKNN